jgi:transcription initiation factor TFIID subunit 9B
MPDTFEVIRLPPPHQRLAEVNFDIVPDTTVVFDEDSEEVIAEQDEEEEDEDMEEVAPEPERDMDEDYDD